VKEVQRWGLSGQDAEPGRERRKGSTPRAGSASPRYVSEDELADALVGHRRWLESGGIEGRRLDLSGCDVAGAPLQGARLSRAAFSRALLRCAVLSGTDLIRAEAERVVIEFASQQQLFKDGPPVCELVRPFR